MDSLLKDLRYALRVLTEVCEEERDWQDEGSPIPHGARAEAFERFREAAKKMMSVPKSSIPNPFKKAKVKKTPKRAGRVG